MTDACSTSHLFLRHCCVSLCPGPFGGLVRPKQVGRKLLYSQVEPVYSRCGRWWLHFQIISLASGDSADEAAGEFGEAEYTALLSVSLLWSPIWMEFPRCFLKASLFL